MPTEEFQSSFNSGELSKKAQARVKIARYESGCKTCENGIVLPVGGFTRRPGFRFAKESKDSATKNSILIPYDAGEDFTYMLEFGDLYMRVFNQDGTPVNGATGSELIVNGDFPTDVASWTDLSTATGVFEWESTLQRAIMRNPDALDTAYMEQSITTVVSTTYQVTFDRAFLAGALTLRVGTTSGGAEVGETTLGVGSHILQFTATATTTYIGLKVTGLTEAQGPELVTNGLFDTDITGWTNQSTGVGSISWSAGRIRTNSGAASSTGQYAQGYQAVSTVIGNNYTVGYDFINAVHETSGSSQFRLGTTAGGTEITSKSFTTGSSLSETFSFTATTTTVYIAFRTTRGTSFSSNEISDWDNVTLTQDDFGTTVDNVSVKAADTPYEIVTPYTEAQLDAIQYTQLEDSMLLAHDEVKLQRLTPTAASSWTITASDYTSRQKISGATGTAIGDMTAGGGLAAGFDGDTYKAAASCATGATSSFLTHIGKNWGSGTPKILAGVVIWSSTDAGFWSGETPEIIFRVQGSNDNFATQTVNLAEFVHQDSNSVISKIEIFNLNDIRTAYQYHRIEMVIKSDAAQASRVAEIEFFEATADNPPGLNDSSTTYAAAIGRYAQRTITGGQLGRRHTVYGSASGEPLNMDQGDASDADAFQHELDSTSSIRWFLDSDDLIIGTTHGVTRMRGTQGPLTASDKQARADVAIGCAAVVPQKMSSSALYIQTDRERVQEVRIDDQGVKLVASDMNAIADHIGDPDVNIGGSRFKGMAAQPDPNKVLWAFHDSGLLTGLTFDRQEQLFGWHRHPMDNGQVISLVPLRGTDGRTEIWAIIKRTINGAVKRSIEIMDPTVYHDGAVKYSGVAATTITGLDHLEGETVSVYGDGYNRGTFTVTGGLITLQETMTTGDIGLAFIPKLEPVTPIRGIGRKRRFGPVLVQLENTQSLWVNGKRQSFRTGADTMGAGVLFTGIKRVTVLGWSREPTLTFEAREPGPFTILNYAGLMETGR